MPTANPNFVNISVIISHNCSNLNRDEANMQKTANFGGATRARISSQCLKYSMRHSRYYREHLGAPSTRSLRFSDLHSEMLETSETELDPEALTQTLAVMTGVDLTKPTKYHKKNPSEDDVGKLFAPAVAAWSKEEIIKAYRIVKEMLDGGASTKEIEKALKKQSASFLECLRSAVDIALSGRMVASGTMPSVDGSLCLAHPITTHAVEGEFDWFTATDDIGTKLKAPGSAHMNGLDFSSGVFYRYASIDLRLLAENLGGATTEEVLEIAKHVVYMMATVVPEAKQRSFAAHNLADLAMVTFSDLPCSLANAFETPVSPYNGYLQPSCEALVKYYNKVAKAYSLDGPNLLFTTVDNLEFENITHRMSELTAWVARGGSD